MKTPRPNDPRHSTYIAFFFFCSSTESRGSYVGGGLKSYSDFRSRSLADTREDNIAVVDIAVNSRPVGTFSNLVGTSPYLIISFVLS